MSSLNTAIVFVIFNRPETTKEVFKSIKVIKPKELFIVADGPRPNKRGDLLNCENTRKIVENVDWDCDVYKNYSEINLGCKIRVSSGIDWAFEHVDKAIILEDDCLPHPDFFLFCDEILNRYKNDERIHAVSGTNLFNYKSKYSYFFSSFAEIWGWATWKRAWKFYDVKISQWDQLKQNDFLSNIFNRNREISYWKNVFNDLYDGNIDTWDYQWLFAMWLRGSLNIIPSNNLISNIGYSNSTHNLTNRRFDRLPLQKTNYPLQHPEMILREKKYDELYQRYFTPNYFDKFKKYLHHLYYDINK